MATFAHVNDDNVVINVLLADTKEIAELVSLGKCVEYNDDNPAFIGGTYDEKTNKFFPLAE